LPRCTQHSQAAETDTQSSQKPTTKTKPDAAPKVSFEPRLTKEGMRFSANQTLIIPDKLPCQGKDATKAMLPGAPPFTAATAAPRTPIGKVNQKQSVDSLIVNATPPEPHLLRQRETCLSSLKTVD